MTGNLAELFSRLKDFVGFTEVDAANLVALAPLVAKYGPKVTDDFYARLAAVPETAKFIEGRVDALKKTHAQWMSSLVGGDYGEAYFQSRWRVGMAHVRIGLDTHWVEGVMSFIRTSVANAIAQDIKDPVELASKVASFTKICDLDLLIVNLSYSEDRLDRLSNFTGMKRNLIENIIRLPPKSKS